MVFALGCLKKSLLALVAVTLLVSVGQLVLLFINNKIFGAFMFLTYILFFLAILLALCRDSVSMYAASAILLIIFVIGCSLIQAYDVKVKDLLNLSMKSGDGEGGSSGAGAGGAATSPPARRRRREIYQLLQSQWKPEDAGDAGTFWDSEQYPAYIASPQPLPNVARPKSKEAPQYDYQPAAPSLPPQPTMPNVAIQDNPAVLEPESGAQIDENVIRDRSFRADNSPDPPAAGGEDSGGDKKYYWRNELRWVSNILGVLHILILAVVICILYEMLFGGQYRYRTWC